MPNVIVLLLHIGGLIQTLKDVESGVADAVKGNFKAADVDAVLADLLSLLQAGVLNLPATAITDITTVIQGLEKAI
jgi:hypothetical protein